MIEDGGRRRRNLRPRRPLVVDYAEPITVRQRSVRPTRAKIDPSELFIPENENDDEWEKAKIVQSASVPHSSSSRGKRQPHQTRRKTRLQRRMVDDEENIDESEASNPISSSSDEESEEVQRNSSSRPRRKRVKPKMRPALPEDVYNRPLLPQPEADRAEIKFNPSIAFLAIFVATFADLFSDIDCLPSPQSLEWGLSGSEPSPLVEFLFRRLLKLVLNRKKELEVGRYSSALSELHALQLQLGVSPSFPALNWKTRENAFQALSAADRAELLHVLVHWCLTNSDHVKALLRNLPEESTLPWMGADDKGNHFYIVGFDPIAEGSEEYTEFRVYKESNRLLATVKWEPVASNVDEVLAFLSEHEIKSEDSEEGPKTDGNNTHEETGVSQEIEETGPKKVQETESKESPQETQEIGSKEFIKEAENPEVTEAAVNNLPAEQPFHSILNPSTKFNLPDTVVEILRNLLPAMQRSDVIRAERLAREEKKARRKRDLLLHTEAVARGEGRYSLRSRRPRVDYSEMLKNAYGDVSDNEDDGTLRKRRLRSRGQDYAWGEPEPETRQQRHARLLAERERAEYETVN